MYEKLARNKNIVDSDRKFELLHKFVKRLLCRKSQYFYCLGIYLTTLSVRVVG
jgi:hypothetical protein